MGFDWRKVKDNNTDTQTSETPSGIDHVFINGLPALNQGKIDTRTQPGAVL